MQRLKRTIVTAMGLEFTAVTLPKGVSIGQQTTGWRGGGVGVRKGGLKTNALPITLFWYNEELLNLSTVASNLIRHLDISNDTPCLHIICYHIQRHQRP